MLESPDWRGRIKMKDTMKIYFKNSVGLYAIHLVILGRMERSPVEHTIILAHVHVSVVTAHSRSS